MSDMDASVAARIVAEECSIWDIKDQHQLMIMISRESVNSGMSIEEYVHFMCEQWKEYKRSITELEYAYTRATRFFSSTIWHDQSLWPRRKQQAGLQAQTESSPEEHAWIKEYRQKNGLAPLIH